MSTTILIKRGAEANRSTVVPQDGELLLTSDQHKLYVGDGAQSGGFAVTASNAETASFYRVNNPSGQEFYGASVSSSVAGVLSDDRVEDAINKVELILEKLAPAKPPMLSTKTLSMVSAYSANRAGTNTTISTVQYISNPVFQLTGGVTASNEFGDGDAGSLTASIDGVSVGSTAIAANPTSNVGTYGQLQITANDDFYSGQAGKANFWRALMAQINATGVTTVGPHSASLSHSTTGKTADYIFYIDDPVTPTITSASVSGSGISYVSGVPALVGGQNGASIAFNVTGSNVVGRFYNSTRIFALSGTGVTSTNFSLPSSPVSGSTQMASSTVSVNAASTGENPSYTITAYNSRGSTGTYNITNTHLRLDSTLDTSNRVKSSTGQYPSTGYGATWIASASLADAGVEELQMLNGQYQYPTGNYTAALPIAGPNYSALPAVSFGTVRWVTFNLGTQTNIQNVSIAFNNSSNLGSSALVSSGWYLQVKVEGATGWVDGNAAYPGAGSPVADGAAALVVASSTGTTKMVTFGSTPRSGNVYVRVGISSGQTYKFGSITPTFS